VARNDKVKRILILMSDTGGGHRASAEAIRDAFGERFGRRYQVEIIDLLAQFTLPPHDQVSKAYRFLVDDVPWLYRFIYEVGQRPELIAPVMEAAARLLQPFVSRTINKHEPSMILSVHPLMQAIPLDVLKRMGRDTPFVTVVTDWITIPPVWFDPRVALCFVPSQEGRRLALQNGLQSHQLHLAGLPIRPAFSRPLRPKAEMRSELGLVPHVPAALIVSGGEGMGRVHEVARAIAVRLAEGDGEGGAPAGQMILVCGRNEELRQQLSRQSWPIPTTIRGFVDDMWNWMAASDCIITKAGPGTIAEALALGLPVLVNGYIPGQETGNVPYVLKNGAGVYVTDPWQIAEVIHGWFGPQRRTLEQLADNARRLGRPEAAFEIVERITNLLLPSATGDPHW
jgi:1,2-diacylglycerol 3-beta-galactosyltransferase